MSNIVSAASSVHFELAESGNNATEVRDRDTYLCHYDGYNPGPEPLWCVLCKGAQKAVNEVTASDIVRKFPLQSEGGGVARSFPTPLLVPGGLWFFIVSEADDTSTAGASEPAAGLIPWVDLGIS